MKILILTNGYPNNYGSVSRMFVHVRSIYYKKNDLDFDVLNFQAKEDYMIDGVKVIKPSSYRKHNYDIAICHSSNLRHHYMFLKKNEKEFKHIFFFFHGFEIMRLIKDYPKPYKYMNRNKFKEFLLSQYDELKLSLWQKYYKSLISKSDFIFVSNYLYDKFVSNLRIHDIPELKKHIINNGVGNFFLKNTYKKESIKKYDFVTIRSDMDGSKYCIDLICENAVLNPDFSFLVIGKGEYFKHNPKPDNITYIEDSLTHDKILEYLADSRCALMPTRWDTQGVMSCEMVTYGIPLITSDIPVCREIFQGCKNVRLIPNDACCLKGVLEELENTYDGGKVKKWDTEKTVKKEIELICSVIKSKEAKV